MEIKHQQTCLAVLSDQRVRDTWLSVWED